MGEVAVTESVKTLDDVVSALSILNNNIVNESVAIIVLLSGVIGVILASFLIHWFK